MGLPKRLTEMQKRFAELLVFGGPDVNAETNRGKAAGLYIDRKIIKTGKLEDLSEQELEAKMKQILEDYSQIIDVTPNKITK
jgi:predicted metal-dependent hydrolase